MAQILFATRPPGEVDEALTWSPVADPEVTAEMESFNLKLPDMVGSALAKVNADGPALAALTSYFGRIRTRAERGWFVRIAAEISGGTRDALEPAMAAAELRYWATLILDDIADRSPQRCGGPTLHITEGDTRAMYLAEVLYGASQGQLADFVSSSRLAPDIVVSLLTDWARTHAKVNMAQYQDLWLEDVPLSEITPDEALRLIDGTTAVEIESCFRLGAKAATDDDERIDALGRVGRALGMLMQIRDDCLDFAESAEDIAKQPLLDVANSRKKVPLVVGYHLAPAADRAGILALLEQAPTAPQCAAELRRLLFHPAANTYLGALVRHHVGIIRSELLQGSWRNEAVERLWRFAGVEVI